MPLSLALPATAAIMSRPAFGRRKPGTAFKPDKKRLCARKIGYNNIFFACIFYSVYLPYRIAARNKLIFSFNAQRLLGANMLGYNAVFVSDNAFSLKKIVAFSALAVRCAQRLSVKQRNIGIEVFPFQNGQPPKRLPGKNNSAE